MEFINDQLNSLKTTNTRKKSHTRKNYCFFLHTASYVYLPLSILQTFFNVDAPSIAQRNFYPS
jgi:hypothetical protein